MNGICSVHLTKVEKEAYKEQDGATQSLPIFLLNHLDNEILWSLVSSSKLIGSFSQPTVVHLLNVKSCHTHYFRIMIVL